MVKTGDCIVTGLRRNPNVQKKYFLQMVYLGIGGYQVHHVLQHASNIDLPNSTQCGTKNIDNNKPSTTGNGIMKIASVILKKNNNNKAIITSLLPQDKNYMLRQKKKKNSRNKYITTERMQIYLLGSVQDTR